MTGDQRSFAGRTTGRRWLWLLSMTGVIALTVLVYGRWTIELALDSRPDGAVVRIDGRAVGVTPVLLSPKPGRHRIELTHPHYQPSVLTLEVRRGDRLRHEVDLTPGVGRLSLLSNPRGARVALNGVWQEGVTPLEVEAPTGPVTVLMSLGERRPREKRVIVLADQLLEVNLELDMDPHGSLTVAVSPEDASVRLPELDLDYRAGLRVPVGEQLIEVSRTGYETQRIRFNVHLGDNHTRVNLTPQRGVVHVRTSPTQADVRITYEEPPGRPVSVAYREGVSVPAGPVGITVRALGFRTEYRLVDVGPRGVRLDVALSAMNVRLGDVFRDPLNAAGQGPAMVVVPAGRFIMGEPNGPPSVTPASVRTLSQPFAVSVNEVSVAEYRVYALATGVEMDARLTAPLEPVRHVSWSQAVAYADWLSRETGQKYRLPTEAEWEYVAKGDTDTAYFFGDDESQLCRFANVADQSAQRIFRDWEVAPCDDGFAKHAPVGTYAPNPFGVHDLLGNVAEWVQECGVPPYAGAPEDGSLVNRGQSCGTHGVRGGAWDSKPGALESTQRRSSRDGGDDKGIRLVKEL